MDRKRGREYAEGRLIVHPDEEEEEQDLAPSTWGLTLEGTPGKSGEYSNLLSTERTSWVANKLTCLLELYGPTPTKRSSSSATRPDTYLPSHSGVLPGSTSAPAGIPMMLPPAGLIYGPGPFQQSPNLLQPNIGFGQSHFTPSQAGKKIDVLIKLIGTRLIGPTLKTPSYSRCLVGGPNGLDRLSTSWWNLGNVPDGGSDHRTSQVASENTAGSRPGHAHRSRSLMADS